MKPYDKASAGRAWTIAVRLKEQSIRLGVDVDLTPLFPDNGSELAILEREIQSAAKTLAKATSVFEGSLENLVDALERLYCNFSPRQNISYWQG